MSALMGKKPNDDILYVMCYMIDYGEHLCDKSHLICQAQMKLKVQCKFN